MPNIDKIAISRSKVNTLVNNLKDQNKSVNDFFDMLNNTVESIDSAWKGRDAVAYTKKMRDDYSVLLKDYNRCLESYTEFLNHVYDEYKDLDEEYKNKYIEV